MAYTVSEAYTKVLEQADKLGSDYFSLPQVLRRFKTCTYDFMGPRIKRIEETQEVTDDMRPLVAIGQIPTIASPDEANCYNAGLPSDYQHRLNVIVEYSDNMRSVEPRIERIGEHNTNMADPYKNPTKDYPLITQMSNSFKIYTGGAVASKLWLTYIKRPLFGVNLNDVVLNLPDQAVEDIIKLTVADLVARVGDARAPIDLQLSSMSRNPKA